MSDYRACRRCKADLMSSGHGFGALECCCNKGYCMDCCPDKRKTAKP